MRTVLIVAILTSISGCSIVKYNAMPQSELINRPEVGKLVTAQLGDYLIEKGNLVREEVLVVSKPIKGATFQIPPGTFKKLGSDKNYDFYSPAGVTFNFLLGEPADSIAIRKSDKKICATGSSGSVTCYTGAYEQKTVLSPQSDSFEQTLIYNGRVGDRINVGYREFSNNFARPAFSNEVQYDLSESKTIGYKGAALEIVDANNSSITYRVLKPFP